MHMAGHFASWMLVGWLAAGVQAPTAAPRSSDAASYELKITTRAEYPEGSDEARQIGEWLREHIEFLDGEVIGDPSRLGDVRVAYTATRRGDTVASADWESRPATPLPQRGAPGDVIEITSFGGDAFRSWSYEWTGSGAGGRWNLIHYSFELAAGSASDSE